MASSIIAVIGGLVVDLIMVTNRLPDEGETGPSNSYHKALGGKGANAAIAAQRTCRPKPNSEDGTVLNNNSRIHVRMIGSVGNDEYQVPFKEELEKNGVDASGIRVVDDMTTSLSFVIVEEDSRNNRILCYAGATDIWTPQDFMSVESFGTKQKPDLVISVMEINTPTVEQVLLTTGKAGIDLLLNAAPASNILMECYQYLTHLLINESEAAILSGMELEEVNKDTWPDIAKLFLKLGVKNVVITLGEAGAYYANKEVSGHFPAFQVQAVDSTGAGDTFTGAYATEYVRQKRAEETWDILKAVRRACMASALTIGKMGAQEGIPWADEIDRFAEEHDTRRVPAGIAILNVQDEEK